MVMVRSVGATGNTSSAVSSSAASWALTEAGTIAFGGVKLGKKNANSFAASSVEDDP